MPKIPNDATYRARLQDDYSEERLLPAYETLRTMLGLASRSAVAKMLRRLREAGLLERGPHGRWCPSERFFERALVIGRRRRVYRARRRNRRVQSGSRSRLAAGRLLGMSADIRALLPKRKETGSASTVITIWRDRVDNLISLEEAANHLRKNIPDADCRKTIADFMAFVIEWNRHRRLNHRVFTYVREDINIAFALDRKNHKERDNKPNFLVIKLAGTDRECKQIHADFDLGPLSAPPPHEFEPYLMLRPSRATTTKRPRWIATDANLQAMGPENFQQLFLTAYQRKGGVQ